jgi:hypothetical protein
MVLPGSCLKMISGIHIVQKLAGETPAMAGAAVGVFINRSMGDYISNADCW